MRLPLTLLILLACGLPAQAATAYRVRSGDTLGGIAERAGVSVSRIRAINPSLQRSSVVQVGRVLQIPNRQLAAKKYHVRGGENLTTIARKFGMSAAQLLRANPQYKGGKNVWAGAVITIPARNVAAGLGRASDGVAVIRTAGIRVSKVASSNSSWAWPLPGYHFISSGYGMRELDGSEAMHYGVDIVAPVGTPVLAARSGRVLESRADFDRGWGWTVVLEHPDGWITRYAHLSQNMVKAGETVVRGQPIGRVGNTGHSTGPHLHYGTYFKWNPKNPMALYD